MILYSRKGQIFPIIVAIVAILIIAALISANVGKVSLDRLYCQNAADAGSIAGISDFVCGYNKVRWNHIAMIIIYAALQAYLAWPQWFYCFPFRHMIAIIGKTVNAQLYFSSRPIVKGYSESVRTDAYNFAFNNAGIDDKYKVDGGAYRDKPHPGEDWRHWTGLRSAFSEWQRGLPEGWEKWGALTYNWHNESKWVRISCNSSPPEDLRARKMPLIGIYLIPTPYGPIPIPLPHGMIHAWLISPSEKRVTIIVERGYQVQERNLGFWRVRHPNTTGSSRSIMSGSFNGGFHL